MLATLVPRPFHKPNWVYEEKYDGIRIFAYKFAQNEARYRSRKRLPEPRRGSPSPQSYTLLLDGEVVVFDQKNVSRFQLLQQRSGEAKYAVFDCLFANGKDLRAEPLSVRRKSLKNAIVSRKVLLIAERLAENGLQAYRLAKRCGIEGVAPLQCCFVLNIPLLCLPSGKRIHGSHFGDFREICACAGDSFVPALLRWRRTHKASEFS
jgi:bifunctional non-homologous end joining protein LigD